MIDEVQRAHWRLQEQLPVRTHRMGDTAEAAAAAAPARLKLAGRPTQIVVEQNAKRITALWQEGKSPPAIAKIVGISVEAVRKRLKSLGIWNQRPAIRSRGYCMTVKYKAARRG